MKFLVQFLIFISAPVFSQTVTTISEGNVDDNIIIDQNDNLYISSFFSGNIIKYTPEGEASLFASGLKSPNGLAFDDDNNLYVCDFADKKILIYGINGNIINFYSITGNPSGILKDSGSDDMIFTNFSENSVNRLTTDGVISIIYSGNPLNGPVGLAQDDVGDLYVSNFNDATVFKVLPNNDLQYLATVPSEGNSPFLGFITYGRGKLWATMLETDKIYTINPILIDDITLFAGSTRGNMNGDISEATFNAPNGIAMSNDANTLYVTDSGSNNLRVISDLALSTEGENIVNFNIDIFPNPVSEKLNILLKSRRNVYYNLSILNSIGTKVKSINNNSLGANNSITLDVNDLKSGMYFLILNADGETHAKQLIKI